ncbi:receptor-like protein 12 [Solanum tuberosum]|uniref:receptor-like protein 12 n=1 Tax=Solanum tuberosum TaxID=4113 RepID=UPI0003D28D14|nr:PREDICTED: receptor-like protein 12 [Solanum tuberosum]
MVFLITSSNSRVYGQCLRDQMASLLKLKHELTFDSSIPKKIVRWNRNIDCCLWSGVSCDEEGHVLVLELDNEAISGGVDNSSSLFDLQHLEKLNLAYNDLRSLPIPTDIYKLLNLTYLNLSQAGFEGQIPVELSRLTKLVVLDISTYNDIVGFPYSLLSLESPDLGTLVGSLANLRELYLDGVNVSLKGSEWCSALSSSLPQLRVLSMRYCEISGPIDPVLVNLPFLSVIRLDMNNLSTMVPDFLADFTKLTTLSVRWCNLFGSFPSKIFQVPTLQQLDLLGNVNLTGTLPEFPQKNALRELSLRETSFTGLLPNSIANLRSLITLDLYDCNFRGPIPSTMGNLTNLVSLDLSNNNFTGSIPLFHEANKLNYIDISNNNGQLSSAQTQLAVLLSLPSLQYLYLYNSHLSGEIHEFPNASSSVLETLYLSNNHLNGLIPRSIFKLNRLSQLSLSSNSFSGTINIEAVNGLPRLTTLDLSDNKIEGKIPNWVWTVAKLNLSHNLFESLEKPYYISTTSIVIDLSFNRIKGNPPFLPDRFANWKSSITYFSIANNEFTGSISSSICSLDQLQFLDMLNNSISGKIPPCLIQMLAMSLVVLNIGRNNLSGIVPDTFPLNCSLETLDLSRNMLEGKVPSSLQRCEPLQVLNIGNNKIKDTFPCMLKKLYSFHVLVIRSNKFYGNLQCSVANQTWSRLQIVDLAYNNFSGDLLPHYFSSWEGMMQGNNPYPWEQYLSADNLYQDKVTLTIKGLTVEYVKILVVLTSIDFSCNNFQGEIPETLGDLKSLIHLNFSHNALTGRIPNALGNLTQLESLDFSVNHLRGRIPDELVSLTFLAFLNLSFNQLSGRIPSGNQLQTFSANSFEGNTGLCDLPLKKTCSETKVNGSSQLLSSHSEHEIEGKYISFSLGSSVGFGIIIWLLLHSQRCNELLDRLLFRMLDRHKKRRMNKNL